MYKLGEKGVAQLAVILLLILGVAVTVSLATRSESFKLFPKASGPTISTNPPTTTVAPALGTTLVSWNTNNGTVGQVYVSINGEQEVLFAEGTSGSQSAPWLQQYKLYTFKLYQGTAHTEVLAQAKAINKSPGNGMPFVRADPNPVPVTSGIGTTRITWDTHSTSFFENGQVYVVMDNGDEVLFASGRFGSLEAPWIQSGHTYKFKLVDIIANTNIRIPWNTVETTVTAGDSNPILTPTISADPNPVNAVEYAGTTRITWNGAGSEGEVLYFKPGEDGITLFARGASGSKDYTGIQPGETIIFLLYDHNDGEHGPIAEVTVTGQGAGSFCEIDADFTQFVRCSNNQAVYSCLATGATRSFGEPYASQHGCVARCQNDDDYTDFIRCSNNEAVYRCPATGATRSYGDPYASDHGCVQ